MSCDVGKAIEALENKLWHIWSDWKVGEWAEFSHFTYITAHSPTLPSIYLCHSSFSNTSVASPTSQLILQTFFRFSYVTGSSLMSPGELPMIFDEMTGNVIPEVHGLQAWKSSLIYNSHAGHEYLVYYFRCNVWNNQHNQFSSWLHITTHSWCLNISKCKCKVSLAQNSLTLLLSIVIIMLSFVLKHSVDRWTLVFIITAVNLIIPGVLYQFFSSSQLQEWNSPHDHKNHHQLEKMLPEKEDKVTE